MSKLTEDLGAIETAFVIYKETLEKHLPQNHGRDDALCRAATSFMVAFESLAREAYANANGD